MPPPQSCRFVRTDPGFRADLKYWRNHLDSWNGSARWRFSSASPIVIASGASLQGFGLHVVSVPTDIDSSSWSARLQLGAGISGAWSSVHSSLCRDHRSITACELFAMFAAAWSFRDQLKDRSVLFQVDNESDVSIINRQSTRSQLLACILRALFDLANKFNFSLRAAHLPHYTKFNHREEWNSLFPAHFSSLLSVSCVRSHQFTVPCRIEELVAVVASAALRKNTQASYANQQKNWFVICDRIGVNTNRPNREQELCAVCIFFCLNHK